MSSIFKYPFNPIPWDGSPQDLSGDSADVPYLGLYTAETTQRFIYGTRKLTWDGRVFKYSKATGTRGGGRLAYFSASVATYGVAYTTVGASQVVGDTQVSISSKSFAEDVLAGGLVLLYGSDYTYNQQRMILGNDYCSSTTLTMYLDAPLATAITSASTAIEVCPNPYRYIAGVQTYGSCSGLPCTRVVSGESFWQQTWGLCNVEPGMTIGPGSMDYQLVTGYGEGAVYLHDATHATTDQCQHCGFIVDAGNACVPFIMLQISI